MTVRISDPRPAYCSACHNSPDVKFVDFDAAHDAGAFVNRETQAYIEGSDDLHLCANCLRDASEVLALKPVIHARQAREIARLTTAVDHWRDYAHGLEATLQERPDPAPRATRRKVAA